MKTNDEIDDLAEYGASVIGQLKTIFRMADEEIARILRVSRPTLALIKVNPLRLTLAQIKQLESYKAMQVATLKLDIVGVRTPVNQPITQESK